MDGFKIELGDYLLPSSEQIFFSRFNTHQWPVFTFLKFRFACRDVCVCSSPSIVLSTCWHPAPPMNVSMPILQYWRNTPAEVTKLRHICRDIPGILLLYILMQFSRVDNAMPCHRTGYDRHDFHLPWRRENRTKTMKNKSNKNQKKVSCPPEGDLWQTIRKQAITGGHR